MSSKKNFVLRIDEETFKALEKWAGDEFRSVNGQLEWIIDQALKESGRKKKTDNLPPTHDKKQP
ncbi:Arc family DNA-binding protein [Pseudoflavitalea sp. X16]|uniref:Arc family DNA-binding protein n=1 Tax=Paraflavitalea devenefica TaxID=2716334 RepID=UPI0014210380|nr:Arc family DNA-binding protein [Paraflavitalea devenefica]NII25690.1 Arc family DNA-binding protein [Paraflavitalea devenefica]